MQASIRTEPVPSHLSQLKKMPRSWYVRGEVPEEIPVAIVGSRRATGYGRRVARVVASRLAAGGVPVISGLAFGIDAEAHRAALDAGGRTVAVMPCGLDDRSISPQTNLPLARRILERGGALVSEYAPGTGSRKEFYSDRNRLISGFSRCVVVVEAALKSGSMLTAGHAADQSREVWAVPGPIESPVSEGTNLLIDEGTSPLISIDRFVESVGVEAPSGGLLDELAEPVHVDALSETLRKPASEIEAELTKLELSGLVRHEGGRRYVRVA